MKFSFLGFLTKVVFWGLLPILPFKLAPQYLHDEQYSLVIRLVIFEVGLLVSYVTAWILANAYTREENHFKYSYYVNYIFAIIYVSTKYAVFPELTSWLFVFTLLCIFIARAIPILSSFAFVLLGTGALAALKLAFISPLMFFFPIPLAYFLVNAQYYIFKHGIFNYLRFLFPKNLTLDEQIARDAQLSWLSIVRSNKLIADEYHDMDVRKLGLRNVEASSTKSIREESFLQSQDADLLSVALTHINRRDGSFSFDEFLKRASNVFRNVHKALYARDISGVEHLLSDSLAQQLRAKIEADSHKAAAQPISTDLIINDIRIAQVNNDKNFDVIHLFVRAVSYDYYPTFGEKNIRVAEIIKANKKLVEKNYTEYYTFIRKPSAKTKMQAGLLEGQCPNCGTPLKVGQNTRCPSCSSFIRSGAYDWVLSKITPAASWHYGEPAAIAGYTELLELDEDFSVQQVEERAATTYWMLNEAAKAKSPRPLMYYVYNSFITQFYEAIKADKLDPYVLDEVVYESSYLKAITMDEKRVYCYCLSQTHNPRPKQIKGRPNAKLVYVFARDKTGKTKKHDTLSSIHCSNCGAALASSTETYCSYCNSSVNDSGTWLLDRIITELDLEFMQVCVQNRDRVIEVKKQARKEALSVGAGISKSAREVIMVAAQVLMADGVIDEREKQLLASIGEKHGIKIQEMDEILEAIRQGLVYVPTPESQSIMALDTLRVAAKMALADGVVTDDEVDAIANLGLQMGYSKIDVMRIINSEKTAIRVEQERAKARAENTW